MSPVSAAAPARLRGRARIVVSGTLLLALAGVAGASGASALGLSSPTAVPLLGAPITSLPAAPLPVVTKAPTLSIPAPVTGAVTAVGGAVSSGGQALGGAVSSGGNAAGGTLTTTTGGGGGGTKLPAPIGSAVSSAGAALGSAVKSGSAALGGAIAGGASGAGGAVGGVGGAVSQGGGSVSGTVSGVIGGIVGGGTAGLGGTGTGAGSSANHPSGTTGSQLAPGIPVLPSSSPNPLQTTADGGTVAGSIPIAGASPLATPAGSKGAKPTSTTLNPAGISLAQAWGSGSNSILFASDLLPSTAASIVAVPAPLLAAAAQASDAQDGDLLGFVSRHTLPGLLVVIATAFVALVAAGNLKVLEPRLAALVIRLNALDARAKAAALRFAKAPSAQVKG